MDVISEEIFSSGCTYTKYIRNKSEGAQVRSGNG